MQVMKHKSEGIHPDFETQGRRLQKPRTGVSVAEQKGLMYSKLFFKKSKKYHRLRVQEGYGSTPYSNLRNSMLFNCVFCEDRSSPLF